MMSNFLPSSRWPTTPPAMIDDDINYLNIQKIFKNVKYLLRKKFSKYHRKNRGRSFNHGGTIIYLMNILVAR